MVLKVIGSSSLGNGYILKASDGVLLIEAGVPFAEVKKSLGWDLTAVQGCIASHSHSDHSGFVKEVMKSGIKVLAPDDVFKGINYSKIPNIGIPVKSMMWYNFGPFRVLAFPVEHDVPCVGYVVEHTEMGRLLFITDTMMCKYVFPGISHMMIEANYSDSILDENIESGAVPASMKGRLLRSHMEIKTALGVIEANAGDNLRTITLIHLSALNSDAEDFKNRVARAVAIEPYIAAPGVEIPLTDNPY